MINRFNICAWKNYEKDGDVKKQYTVIGYLIEFPATQDKKRGFKIEIPIFGHERFAVFEQKPKNDAGSGQNAENDTELNNFGKEQPEAKQVANTPNTGEDINPSDIPF